MRGLALASKIVVAGLAGAFLTVSAVRAEPARPAPDPDAPAVGTVVPSTAPAPSRPPVPSHSSVPTASSTSSPRPSAPPSPEPTASRRP
ncbi:hypothetical protein [Streptomyces sp. NPDC059708]|uniref:hypothetical protein n=1 Tax=Streptomyces sp. NPDC059708 TaxID=3346916 RepID=UPI0036C4AD02